MKNVELYAKVRYAVRIEGLSKRAVARRFGVDPRTVDKMLEFSVPPGYRRSKPPAKPKLGPFVAIIARMPVLGGLSGGNDRGVLRWPCSGIRIFWRRPAFDLYNTKIAVARILGDGKRQRTRVFSELQSHYLFEDRFGRPGKGNDKGKVEGLIGYARRNFLVPLPVSESFEALNGHLLNCCRSRLSDRLRGHSETIGERLERDLAAFVKPLAPAYEACEKLATTVSSLSLVRYRRNDYSVPTSFGHRDVIVRGYVHEVVISCGAQVVARHPRSTSARILCSIRCITSP